jgi:hypothetical protein
VTGRKVSAAQVVSLALNPSALTGAFFILLAVTLQPTGARRLLIASVAFLFAALVPLASVFLLHGSGRLSDVEMRSRIERTPVFLWCAAGYFAGAGVLFALGAAWQLWGLLALHVPNTLVLLALNRRWKISIHAMVLAGLWTAGLLFYGVPAVPAGGLLPLAAWARWAAGAHTLGELVGGATLGPALTLCGITALRSLVGP